MEETDPKIGLQEVQSLLRNEKEFQQLVDQLYQDFDTDENGKIDFNEGEILVKQLNEDMAKSGCHKHCKIFSQTKIKSIVAKFDENDDKILQQDEFYKLVRFMMELEIEEYQKDLEIS